MKLLEKKPKQKVEKAPDKKVPAVAPKAEKKAKSRRDGAVL